MRFIKDSQQLGFTLKEIKDLLEIHESAKSLAGSARSESKEWQKAFRIARERLELISQKITFLTALRKPLAAALDQPGPEKAMVCPASLMVRSSLAGTDHRQNSKQPTSQQRKKSA